jgi:hypothetical protein
VFTLGLLALTAAAPEGPTLPGPAFAAGDEIVYAGEVLEVSERFDLPYRRKSALEVRLFVLSVGRDWSDIAVMTKLRPLEDPEIAAAVKAVTGNASKGKDTPPAVRLDLVRVDPRGRVRLLTPPAGPPPIPLGAKSATAPFPPAPLDIPPASEAGMFVPLPEALPAAGTTWEVATESGRPPSVWEVKPAAVWNGAQVLEAAAVQQSAEWTKPVAGRTAWRQVDRVWVSPVDGLARVVHREVERKDASTPVGRLAVRYEMKPPTAHRGESYLRVRREIEYAWSFAAAADPLVPRAATLGPRPFEAIIAKIEKYKTDHPPTAYREAIEAVLRRCEAAARGEVSAVPAAVVAAPAVGQPAPDFLAKDVDGPDMFRLSDARGPVVLIFYKPGSETSAGTLAVAEALHRKYVGKATVVPLAVYADAAVARAQRSVLKLTVPVRDGESLRQTYAVMTFPRFLLIAGGVLRWQFEGYGGETGYLVKTELEGLLK